MCAPLARECLPLLEGYLIRVWLMLKSLRKIFAFMHDNILIMTVTGAMGMFARSMVFPYASLYILALGGEPAQIGLVNSLRPLAGLIAFPIAGYLADRVSRVKVIGFTGYFSGAILLMYVLAPSWRVIALAGLLQGFAVLVFGQFCHPRRLALP